MRLKINVRNFKKIRPHVRRTRSHAVIYRRRGLPFVIHRYRKRKGIVVGLALAVLFLAYTSLFVTGIEITGYDELERGVISEKLREFGVYPGRFVASVDTGVVRNRMMIEIPELAWIGINKSGSKIHVDVRERKKLNPVIEKDVPCNIIARRSGMIERMDIREGRTLVNIDDAVDEGDLLVSGIMETDASEVWYVHAFGEVYARTWYEKSKDYPLRYNDYKETGEFKTFSTLEFMNLKINLYISDKIPYTVYAKTSEDKFYGGFWNTPPLKITSTKYTEQTVQEKKRSFSDALIYGRAELFAELESEIPEEAEVMDKRIDSEILTDGTVRIKAVIECFEDIAQKAVIEVDNRDN